MTDPTPTPVAAPTARALAAVVLVFGIVAGAVGLALPAFQLTQDQAAITVSVVDPTEVLPTDLDALPIGASLEIARADALQLVATDLPGWLRALTRLPQTVAGLLLLAGTLLPKAFDGLAGALVTSHLGGLPEGGPLGVPLFSVTPLLPLIVAWLLVVAAQVVEAGRRLNTDLEEVV